MVESIDPDACARPCRCTSVSTSLCTNDSVLRLSRKHDIVLSLAVANCFGLSCGLRSGTDSCVKGLCWPKVPRASPLLTAHSEEQNSHTSLLDLVCLPRLSLSCIHTSDPVSWLFVADAAAGGGLAAGSVLLCFCFDCCCRARRATGFLACWNGTDAKGEASTTSPRITRFATEPQYTCVRLSCLPCMI